jgi:hypothetical protein
MSYRQMIIFANMEFLDDSPDLNLIILLPNYERESLS